MIFSGYLMGGEHPVARIERNQVISINQARMPLYLVAGGDFEGWLSNRDICCHSFGSHILNKDSCLMDISEVSAVLRTHATAITDYFWVKSDGEPDISYEQVRFQGNAFDNNAICSCKGYWRLENGRWWLYKRERLLERFSELFIPTSNDPSRRVPADIWRMPRGY